jgi:PPM family protein phosphatase
VPGSGATVVALSLDGSRAHLAWAGDSRGYRWRDGVLTRLTRDHSLVQEMVDAGILAPASAVEHPQAHVVTQAIGAAENLTVESVSVDVASGDRFLLCSDGLSHRVDDAAIAACLGREPDAAADALVAEALARDGSDNVSVVVVAA